MRVTRHSKTFVQNISYTNKHYRGTFEATAGKRVSNHIKGLQTATRQITPSGLRPHV
jgi:hypothetical protein